VQNHEDVPRRGGSEKEDTPAATFSHGIAPTCDTTVQTVEVPKVSSPGSASCESEVVERVPDVPDVDVDEISVASESFVMIANEDEDTSDRDSTVSLVMPEPEVDGRGNERHEDAIIPELPTYHQRAASVRSSKVIDNLFILYDMGFKDFTTNLSTLELLNNDLSKSVAKLCEHQEEGV